MSRAHQQNDRASGCRIGSRTARGVILGASWLLMLAALPRLALTQQSADPFEVCFALSAPSARLACFDGEMRRRHATAAAPGHAPAGVPLANAAPVLTPASSAPGSGTSLTATPAPAADDTIGLDGRQLLLRRKAEHIQREAPKPLVARLSHLTLRSGHQYYFELDNGQIWESTDTQPDLFLSPNETVTIRSGFMGAFFLKTQEGNSIRVHRLR